MNGRYCIMSYHFIQRYQITAQITKLTNFSSSRSLVISRSPPLLPTVFCANFFGCCTSHIFRGHLVRIGHHLLAPLNELVTSSFTTVSSGCRPPPSGSVPLHASFESEEIQSSPSACSPENGSYYRSHSFNPSP